MIDQCDIDDHVWRDRLNSEVVDIPGVDNSSKVCAKCGLSKEAYDYHLESMNKSKAMYPHYLEGICHVFALPEKFPEGFCSGGGKPTTMLMVDWFDVEGSVERFNKSGDLYDWSGDDWDKFTDHLTSFLIEKVYIVAGTHYLCLFNFGKSFIIVNKIKYLE